MCARGIFVIMQDYRGIFAKIPNYIYSTFNYLMFTRMKGNNFSLIDPDHRFGAPGPPHTHANFYVLTRPRWRILLHNPQRPLKFPPHHHQHSALHSTDCSYPSLRNYQLHSNQSISDDMSDRSTKEETLQQSCR